MTRSFALLFLIVLFENVNARPRYFDYTPKRLHHMSYSDDVFPIYGDNQQPHYNSGYDRPRMSNGGFCCGGWGAGRVPLQQWHGQPSDSKHFPLTYGSPFPQTTFDQHNQFSNTNNYPSVMPHNPIGFSNGISINGHPSIFGRRTSDDQFEQSKFYGRDPFVQPTFNDWSLDSNSHHLGQLNDVSRRAPKTLPKERESESSEHDSFGQGVNSATPVPPLKFDPETGLLIDTKSPLGQQMDNVEGGFDQNTHFKSGELGQELTKGQKEDLANGGKFEYESE